MTGNRLHFAGTVLYYPKLSGTTIRNRAIRRKEASLFAVFIIAVTVALVTSGLCSLCEAALLSLSPAEVELLADIDRPITAILTLNTLANTLGASVAGGAAAALFGRVGLVVFSILFTLTVLLFTEILPKTLGVGYARQVGPWMAGPLKAVIVALGPLVALARMMTRLAPKGHSGSSFSAEELKTIASMSRKSGAIQADQEAVIAGILQLGRTTARDIMTPRTVTFTMPAGITVGEATKMEEQWRRHSRVPVYEEEPDNVVGLVLSQDVLLAAAEQRPETTLKSLMRPVHFVPESAPADRIFLDFFEKHQHLFVVVDEYGSVTGVVSMEDILEEIIGREIVDESDNVRNMRELARLWKTRRRGK